MDKANQKIITQSEAETIAFAQRFADSLCDGDVVLLCGDLGMGKSVFCRAVIRHLCDNEDLDVPSPTFTLVQSYDCSLVGEISHFDLYRLNDPEEIYELGWEDAIVRGAVLVEWAERLGALRPVGAIDVIFKALGDDRREIAVMRNE